MRLNKILFLMLSIFSSTAFATGIQCPDVISCGNGSCNCNGNINCQYFYSIYNPPTGFGGTFSLTSSYGKNNQGQPVSGANYCEYNFYGIKYSALANTNLKPSTGGWYLSNNVWRCDFPNTCYYSASSEFDTNTTLSFLSNLWPHMGK